MFAPAAEHSLPRAIDGLLSSLRFLESVPERMRTPRTEALSDTIAEGLTNIAARLQQRAARTKRDANRLGGQLAEAGSDGLALFSKEVSANPMIAVGAALGVGMIVGLALIGTTRRRRSKPRTGRQSANPGKAREHE